MKTRLLFLAASILFAAACGDDAPVVLTDAGTDTAADSSSADVESDASPDAEADADVDGETDVTPDAMPDIPLGPTLDSVHANIFEDSCGGGFCHLNGQEAGGLNLDLTAELEAALMGPSTASGVNMIEPGDSASSYLYLKCSGEFGAVGGSGGQMPLGAPALTDAQLQELADWIDGLS